MEDCGCGSPGGERAAAQRLEAVQEQVAAAEQDIATLEKQKKALQGLSLIHI